jgi:hypothetical protein
MPRIYGAPVNRKLTVEQAVEIRRRRFDNHESMRSLGIEFDVSKQTVSGIIAGEFYPEAAQLLPQLQPTWSRCGHPKTEENTSASGGCKHCQKDYRKRYYDSHKPLHIPGNLTRAEARMIRHLKGRGRSIAALARQYRRGQDTIRAVLDGVIHPDASAPPVGTASAPQLQLPFDPIALYRAEKAKRLAREAAAIAEARETYARLVEVA